VARMQRALGYPTGLEDPDVGALPEPTVRRSRPAGRSTPSARSARPARPAGSGGNGGGGGPRRSARPNRNRKPRTVADHATKAPSRRKNAKNRARRKGAPTGARQSSGR
jgi:hypothetical protein